jgi:ubiquinone/menaquinone biosynthesis C-methylase UbiE
MDQETTKTRHFVCPAACAFGLDIFIRKYIHNPKKILGKFIKEGMTVLDFGCGPGFFTLPVAEMVGETGRVIAADLQDGMLDRLKSKIKGQEIGERIVLHKSSEDKIGIEEKVDLVIAFYVVHELTDRENFFTEAFLLLKFGGKLLYIEPSIEVSMDEFMEGKEIAERAGFKVGENIKVIFSKGLALEKL